MKDQLMKTIEKEPEEKSNVKMTIIILKEQKAPLNELRKK